MKSYSGSTKTQRLCKDVEDKDDVSHDACLFLVLRSSQVKHRKEVEGLKLNVCNDLLFSCSDWHLRRSRPSLDRMVGLEVNERCSRFRMFKIQRYFVCICGSLDVYTNIKVTVKS